MCFCLLIPFSIDYLGFLRTSLILYIWIMILSIERNQLLTLHAKIQNDKFTDSSSCYTVVKKRNEIQLFGVNYICIRRPCFFHMMYIIICTKIIIKHIRYKSICLLQIATKISIHLPPLPTEYRYSIEKLLRKKS